MSKQLQTMLENMQEKTGKTLDGWQVILAKQGGLKHSDMVRFLKTEHGVTHGYANTIVTLVKQNDAPQQDLVAQQYSSKEGLLPIYQALINVCESLGNDVTITPKKSSVSVIRKHQFALIKPATKTRIDLGLKLKDVPLQGVLEASGPFGTMCTHRIQLTDLEQVNQEVIGWLEKAYQLSI